MLFRTIEQRNRAGQSIKQHSCDTTDAVRGSRTASMKFFELFTAAAICVLQWSTADATSQVIRIGGIFPVTDIATAKINRAGAGWLAGSLMAIADLNSLYANSTNYRFKLAVRDSRKTFSNTVVGSLLLSKSVFNNNGSHVIVGAGKLSSEFYATSLSNYLFDTTVYMITEEVCFDFLGREEDYLTHMIALFTLSSQHIC